MQNNYYFLTQLSTAIDQKIKGMELITCFTQNKNELIIGFTSDSETFYIKSHLHPDFCCLTFPNEFHRSKRNSVDLFKAVLHHQVSGVTQYINERCFSIDLMNNKKLLFKMYGNRSNITLLEGGNVIELFNNKLKNDEGISISQLDRPIERSLTTLQQLDGNYKSLYPTFDKHIHEYLAQLSYSDLPIEEQWKTLSILEYQLQEPEFFLSEIKGKTTFCLLPIGEIKQSFNDPIEAVNVFFNAYIKTNNIGKEKKAILSNLGTQHSRTRSYIDKAGKKLETLAYQNNYDQLANIIMANLHNIPTRTTEVTLENLYSDMKPVTIKLKSTLSPQKNAEVYYRKSKNQKIELDKLKESIEIKKIHLINLETQLGEINLIDNIKELRAYLSKNGLDKKQQVEKETPKPYHAYHFDGFDIWVGKNAKHNDTLTQKLSYKEDLWLHAKDVSGSHTLIKHKSDQPYPKHVIEYAAEIAAYYSKRKADSLCPVIYTPKKYVRKVKGAPAGVVVVDKEKVVLVTPNKH